MDLAAPTWYELIDDAAQEINDSTDCSTRLLILPGVEISTTGVHILAIFPPQEPRRKAHFIICEPLNEVGLGPDAWGKNPKAGNANVYDTLALITKKGGLAIPAHIDGSDQSVLELYELTGAAMKNVLQSEHLGAVEVLDPNTLTDRSKETDWLALKAWFDQARREKGLSSLAYFQGSDAQNCGPSPSGSPISK